MSNSEPKVITITRDVGDRRAGDVLEVLGPGEPIRTGAVDAGRAAAWVASKFARVEQVEGGLPPWTLKTPPAEYLEKWPDGKNAELARRHVAAAAAEEEG